MPQVWLFGKPLPWMITAVVYGDLQKSNGLRNIFEVLICQCTQLVVIKAPVVNEGKSFK